MATPSANYTVLGTQFSVPASETEQTDITLFLINALAALEGHTHNGTDRGLAIAGAQSFSSAVTFTSTATHTVSSATALTVAKAGTNYALQVDTVTGSAATGLKITSAPAASGLAMAVISSGTDESLSIDAKGAGSVVINTVATGGITLGRATTASSTLGVTGLLTANAGLTVAAGAILKGAVPLNQAIPACLAASTVGAASTVYSTPAVASSVATENQRQVPMAKIGTVRNLYLVTAGAQPGDGALVATIRKNGADQTVTLTVAAAAAAGTFSDLTNSVAFAAGDLLSLKLANASPGTVSATIIGWGFTYDA